MITRPDFVNFILEDTHSRVLKDYITTLENKINSVIELICTESFLDIDDIRKVLDILGDTDE